MSLMRASNGYIFVKLGKASDTMKLTLAPAIELGARHSTIQNQL